MIDFYEIFIFFTLGYLIFIKSLNWIILIYYLIYISRLILQYNFLILLKVYQSQCEVPTPLGSQSLL